MMRNRKIRAIDLVISIIMICLFVSHAALPAAGAEIIPAIETDRLAGTIDFRGGAMGLKQTMEKSGGAVMAINDDATAVGIDVSYYQGAINWDTVAKNIDFAIIRCGYGDDLVSQDDSKWKYNADACTRLGIPFGVYIYSYALTDAQARSEAQHVLRLLKGYNPQLPIYLDLEEDDILEHCTKEDILRHTRIFCEAMESAGYEAGVYANYNWWTNYLTASEYDRWDRWIARYASSTGYSKEYTIWQYTFSGKVDGISGNVDMNYWYGEFPPNGSHTHAYTSYIAAEANCTQSGTRVYTCACGDSYAEVIPAKGHSDTTTEILPTCTDAGYTIYRCKVCAESHREKGKAALGHTEVIDKAVAATCTTPGLTEGKHCAVCNEVLAAQQTVDALGHRYSNNICTICGDKIGKIEAPVVTTGNKESNGKPSLKWACVDGAVKYEVYRATSKNGTYSRKYRTTGTTYTNSDAVIGQYYYYFVRAVDADGSYADSKIVGRTCDLAQPKATTGNVASSGKITVSWEKVDGAVQYEVWRATSKTGAYKLMKTTTGTSYTNTSAAAGKAYYYKVKAIAENSAANSAYSPVKSRTCDLAQPKATTGNVASSGKITVSWEKVDGAVQYEVWRATSKTGAYKLMKTTTGTSYTNTSAAAGKTYYYKVKAIAENSAANSAYSPVKSRTCDLARPEVSVSLRSGKPKVSWDMVTGAVGYEVYRAAAKSGTYSLVKTTTGNSYQNTGATAGKTYYYKVVAVCANTAGNSADSSAVSIKATK